MLKIAVLATLFWITPLLLIGQTSDEHIIRVRLQEISIVDIEPSGDFTISLETPTEAGRKMKSNVNSSKWINYTVSKKNASNAGSISAQIVGVIPEGIDLILNVGSAQGGGGETGIAIGEIELSSLPTEIISGIGASYTGSGQGNGHNLSYELRVSDYNNLSKVESEVVTVMFTISQ